MKTQLLIDYESSKAFLYYFFILGQFKMEMLEDDRVVDFFGFDRFNISLDDIKKKYLPTVKQRYKISNILAELTLFDEIRINAVSCYSYDMPQGPSDEQLLRELGIRYKARVTRFSDEIIRQTIDVFKIYRNEIIRAVNHDDSFMKLGYVSQECSTFEYYIDSKLYIDALPKYIERPFDGVREFIYDHNPLAGLSQLSRMREVWDPEINAYEEYLDKVFVHFYKVLSCKNGYSLSNRYNIPMSGRSVTINDLKKSNNDINCCMAKISFNKNTMMIPQPETLEDVVNLRKNADMISFRRVYAQWIDCLKNGDEAAYRRMWKDVESARKALEKISGYKKVDGNILTRALFMILGEIPILSEVLSATGFISATAVDHIEKQNRWVCLPGLASPGDACFVKPDNSRTQENE